VSFDLFVQRFQHGAVATFSRSLLDEVFGRGAIRATLPLKAVEYPDGSHAEIYAKDGEELSSFMLSHFGGETVFERVFELADRTGSIIYWPDVRPALAVTKSGVIEHVPQDCLSSIGPAEIVANAKALMDYIARPDPTFR
jgi:hypothetical protein